ncbi:hypothetical protein [Streptomyces sp. cg35]|uniref:hypothetical protein n=1 Tax=Streptomyces sp. cg35 TaxID=3421650 RepID=UPI003D17C6C1
MIPASASYNALFKRDEDGPQEYSSLPVIAWDDEGRALVVDLERGKLMPASGYKGFERLVEADERAVAAVPGAGWSALLKRPDGTTYTDPTIAWRIDVNGYVEGVGMSSRDGVRDDQSLMPYFVRYLAPGEEPDVG